MFAAIILPQKHMNIREAFGVNEKHFKPVKDQEQMQKEGREKIERLAE